MIWGVRSKALPPEDLQELRVRTPRRRARRNLRGGNGVDPSITDLQNAKWLEHKYPETARRLAQLPWVKDGLNTAEEEEIIEDLLQILISQSRPGTLLLNPEEHPTKPLESILDMPFIQSISPGDAQAIRSLKNISQAGTPPSSRQSSDTQPSRTESPTSGTPSVAAPSGGSEKIQPRSRGHAAGPGTGEP